MASTEVVMPELPPTLTLLHEQTVGTLSRMIGAAAPLLLDPTSTAEESPSSPLQTLEPSPAESEVASGMASGASSVKYGSSTPTTLLEPPQCVAFVSHGPDGRVHAGTLSGLMQELVDPNGHRKDKEVFLALYRMFATGEEVLRPLIEQFKAASSSDTAEPSRHVPPCILLVLELWQEFDYLAPTDVGLLRMMRDFVACVQSSPTVSFFSLRARDLVASINKNLALFGTATPLLTPSSPRPSDTRCPAEPHPRDLADLLTSIEGDQYRKLRGFDYVCWLEERQESNAVASFFALNKKLTCWAERFVLKPTRQSQRAENLKYILVVIKECIQLHNFSSACALSAGITTKAITDLKRTYGDLDSKHRRLFREAKGLISVDKNFKAYRTAIKKSGNACIPWIYVHLIYDLKIIHRAPKLVNKDGHKNLINFMRCRCVYRQILQIRDYQPPALQPSNPIHHSKLRPLMDSELNSMIINQKYYDWVQRRGVKIAIEEQMNYNSYAEELRKAGFQPGRSQNSTHSTRRPSTTTEDNINRSMELRKAGFTPSSSSSGPSMIVEGQISHATHMKEPRRAKSVPTLSEGTINSTRMRSTSSPFQTTSSLTPPGSPRSSTPSPTQPPELSGTATENDSRPHPLDIFKRDSERCLDGRIIRPGVHLTTCGGNADIWEGWLDGQKVAIKCIRRFSSNGGHLGDDKLLKQLWREYAAWERISHPNVLECLGFTYDHSIGPSSLPSLISPWMSNGTLPHYITNHPETNRLELLLHVADGLSYLHQQTIIHGDIRGNNILISDSGLPCISDFGLSKVLMLEGYTTASSPGGSMRWMSPELFQGNYFPSLKSDVWAYGMTVLEIMSGRIPYSEVEFDAAAMKLICQGQLPQRSPTYADSKVPDDVWAICQKCWNIMARQRPSMRDVFEEMGALRSGLQSSSDRIESTTATTMTTMTT